MFRLGPILLAARLPERFKHEDPSQWRDKVDTDEFFSDYDTNESTEATK